MIPFHAGMRPYDRVAVQWRCLTIREPGAPSEHAEWIDTDRALPNVAFVRSLREAIGTTGTVYVWSAYESATLGSIRAQMDAYSLGTGDVDRESIMEWLDEMDAGRGTRVVDLNKLALDYYFHPLMKGRTSIKVVLDAVGNGDDLGSLGGVRGLVWRRPRQLDGFSWRALPATTKLSHGSGESR